MFLRVKRKQTKNRLPSSQLSGCVHSQDHKVILSRTSLYCPPCDLPASEMQQDAVPLASDGHPGKAQRRARGRALLGSPASGCLRPLSVAGVSAQGEEIYQDRKAHLHLPPIERPRAWCVLAAQPSRSSLRGHTRAGVTEA